MSEFTNVTVIEKANVYFEGRVVSRTVVFTDGSKKTLGIMQPGEYEFNTGDKVLMEIISGELDVALPAGAGVKRLKRERLSKFRQMPNFAWWSKR